jgi:hypothetical protein
MRQFAVQYISGIRAGVFSCLLQAEHARLRARYPGERYRDNENVLQILEEYMQRRELPQLASRIADTRLATGKSTADLDP